MIEDYGQVGNPQQWNIADSVTGKNIIGKVVARGLAEEHRDRHFLIVDGINNLVHYVYTGSGTLVIIKCAMTALDLNILV